jgi:hypothetical protein
VNWANKDRLPEAALAALLDTFHEVSLDPAHVEGDMLGAAYGYLLREFAEASGKKARDFFTPRPVVHLLTGCDLDAPRNGGEIGRERLVPPGRSSHWYWWLCGGHQDRSHLWSDWNPCCKLQCRA